jgi:membrane protein DedA with SNARE-associated domain
MRFGRFFAFGALGSIVWIGGLAVLGREVGRNWPTWRHHLEYGDYALVGIVVLVVLYLVLRRLRGSRTPPGAAVDAVSE